MRGYRRFHSKAQKCALPINLIHIPFSLFLNAVPLGSLNGPGSRASLLRISAYGISYPAIIVERIHLMGASTAPFDSG